MRTCQPCASSTREGLVHDKQAEPVAKIEQPGLPGKWLNRAQLEVDPACGLVTSIKPADDCTRRTLVRLWETSGENDARVVPTPGFVTAMATDLLERERGALEVRDGIVVVPVRALGFGAIILER